MRFGDYIRDVRRRLNLTQPEAARVIGIEQSYLSKLESGKSYPSEDVFSSIMAGYQIEIEDLNERLFAAELDRLREVSEVRALILRNVKNQQKRTQSWLMAGVGSLVVGGACLGTSLLAEDKEVVQYQYRLVSAATDENSASGTDAEFRMLEDYRDVVFSEDSPDGVREWRLIGGTNKTVKSPLRWFIVPATALILGAFGFFFASYRLR